MGDASNLEPTDQAPPCSDDSAALAELIGLITELIALITASDPDGDGIINIEGMVSVDLTGQCLTITNCEGEALAVELTAENIADLITALEAATLNVELTAENIADLVSALEGACLSFKQCDGEVFDVAVDWDNMPAVEIAGPVDVNVIGGDITVDVDEVDCHIGFVPIVGCLAGECVHAVQIVQHTKSTGETVVLGDTLPAGAELGACPEEIIVGVPVVCCDRRILLEGDETHDIAALLGLGTGYTLPTIKIEVIKASKANPVMVTDCDDTPSPVYCGQEIKHSGGCGDENSPMKTITTTEGDLVILTARVCPPMEATP